MKTSPKLWILGNSHCPFDTSKRLWCLDEMHNFTGTGKSESGTNHLDPLCKAAVPTLSTWEAGDLPQFHCAASTTDTFIHIHIHCQQHGVPLTQRRWQVDFKSAKSAPAELLGSSARKTWDGLSNKAFSCHYGCLWWFFFPPVLIQQWSQSIEQLSLLPIFWKIWSTFDYISILM